MKATQRLTAEEHAPAEKPRYHFCLYVAGDEPNSRQARENLHQLCADYFPENHYIEIIDVLEGDCSLVDCVKNPETCPRVPICASHDVWAIIGSKISETLNSITLDTLVKMNQEKAQKSMLHNI